MWLFGSWIAGQNSPTTEGQRDKKGDSTDLTFRTV